MYVTHSTRGLILRIPREQAVLRALSQIVAVPTPLKTAPSDAGGRPISYRLPEKNGGFDPTAPHCASWSYGDRTPTADCIGFVLWASGMDRCQPHYDGTRDEWLNCASLLDDADKFDKDKTYNFCRPLATSGANTERPQPGDWLLTRDHIAMIVRVPLKWSMAGTTKSIPLVVVDCSPRHGYDNSIQMGTAWSPLCRVIRPLVYA